MKGCLLFGRGFSPLALAKNFSRKVLGTQKLFNPVFFLPPMRKSIFLFFVFIFLFVFLPFTVRTETPRKQASGLLPWGFRHAPIEKAASRVFDGA